MNHFALKEEEFTEDNIVMYHFNGIKRKPWLREPPKVPEFTFSTDLFLLFLIVLFVGVSSVIDSNEDRLPKRRLLLEEVVGHQKRNERKLRSVIITIEKAAFSFSFRFVIL